MVPAQKSPRPSPATLADIARRCQVSKVSVSRALRGITSKVSPAKAAEIRAAAEEMGYAGGASYAGRQLALRRHGRRELNHLVAAFLPLSLFDRPFYTLLYRGIVAGLREERFALLTHHSAALVFSPEEFPFYERGAVDAALVYGHWAAFAPLLERLRTMSGFGNCPVISLVQTMPGCAAVASNDRLGAREAVAYLLGRGHRRILHFWHEQVGAYLERYLGAAEACLQFGLDAREVLLDGFLFDFSQKELAEVCFDNAWRAHPGCTAVMAPNDTVAPWVLDFLGRRGLRVPEDVSVVGFDDAEPVLDDHGRNILTTVRVPLYEIGYEAARLAVRLAREGRAPEQVVLLPTSLVVRGTA